MGIPSKRLDAESQLYKDFSSFIGLPSGSYEREEYKSQEWRWMWPNMIM